MPYNFLDPQQEQVFRQRMLQQGKSPAEIDAYVSSKAKQQSQLANYQGIDPQKTYTQTSPNSYESLQELAKTRKSLSDAGISTDYIDSQLSSRGLSVKKNDQSINTQKLSESERKMYNALGAAQEAKKILEGGLDTGILGNIGVSIGSVFNKTSDYSDYKSKLALATSALKSALLGAAQSSGELRGLADALPKASDQEGVALQKLNNFIDLYGKQFGLSSSPQNSVGTETKPPGIETINVGSSQQISQTQPQQQQQIQAPPIPEVQTRNINGGIAKPGDVVRLDNGKLKIFGTTGEDELLKKSTDLGVSVDSGLIKFLTDSEFLPIVGSVIGGLSGAGIGSVATGAAGAVTGKALQQGLRELVDPDRQTYGEMAKAVLTEGLADAVLGGLTLGIGKVGSKGLGLILSKGTGEVAQEGVEAAGKQIIKEATQQGKKQLSKEAIEAGGKNFLGLSEEQLLNKMYHIQPSDAVAFRETYGLTPHQALIGALEGNTKELANSKNAFEFFKGKLAETGTEIGQKISGKSVPATEILGDLDSLVKSYETNILNPQTGEVSKIFPEQVRKGIKEIVEKRNIIAAEAFDSGFVPLETLQDLKVSLNKVYKTDAFQGTSSEALSLARDTLMGKIEKYGGEGIKDSNMKYRLYDLLADSAGKADNKVIKAAWDAMDLIAAGGATAATGGNIGVGAATSVFLKPIRALGKDPEAQLKFVQKFGKYVAEKGDKNMLRAFFTAVQNGGIDLGIDPVLKNAAVGAKATAKTAGSMFGSQNTQPSQNYYGVDTTDMYTSQSGIPIYK